MRGEGARSGSEHCGHDVLLGGVGGADKSGNDGVKRNQVPSGERPLPRGRGEIGLASCHHAVLSPRELVE